MQARFLDGPFGQIACYESKGDGPTAFLVHGNSASANAFAKQLDGPLGHKYRLIALDLPGHGRSARVDTYGIRSYVAVVTNVAQTLQATDAVFVGWSLGGHTVLQAAPDLPDARGFMIFGTPPLGGPDDFANAFLPHPAMQFIFSETLDEAEVAAYAESGFALGYDVPSSVLDDIRRTDGQARTASRQRLPERTRRRCKSPRPARGAARQAGATHQRRLSSIADDADAVARRCNGSKTRATPRKGNSRRSSTPCSQNFSKILASAAYSPRAL